MNTERNNLGQNRLELVWPGKEQSARPEPRILIEKGRYGGFGGGNSDNLLIQGDNLLGLKALEHDYAGKVKCIYIDPPYNTKSCFTHYDDSMEHSMWLDMMRDRLLIMHRLLRVDGSIWISIDDGECHYLKVMCDEIFGRKNFISNVIWQKKNSSYQKAKTIAGVHENILVYSKRYDIWLPNLLRRPEEMNMRYKNPDKDSRGPWLADNLTVGMSNKERPNQFYPIHDPITGNEYWPKPNRVWSYIPESMNKLISDNRIIFPDHVSKQPRLKRFLFELEDGILPKSMWFSDEVGSTTEAKKESLAINSQDVFPTPKPERLIRRILHIATNEGDLVLDCFAGSGTTGTVAHKMNRRWIMIEMGEHAKTHIIPRLDKVISGKDPGGVTESNQWKGGGGFRFCEIAPSLLQKDMLGRLVINKKYTPQMLKEAMCLHAGFALAEHSDAWWCHGQSTHGAYVYVTPEILTRSQLARLSDEVGSERSCLVFCGAFTCATDEFDNLTIQKIPKSILSKCDWDQEDYSLKNKPTGSIDGYSHPKRQVKVQKVAVA